MGLFEIKKAILRKQIAFDEKLQRRKLAALKKEAMRAKELNQLQSKLKTTRSISTRGLNAKEKMFLKQKAEKARLRNQKIAKGISTTGNAIYDFLEKVTREEKKPRKKRKKVVKQVTTKKKVVRRKRK